MKRLSLKTWSLGVKLSVLTSFSVAVLFLILTLALSQHLLQLTITDAIFAVPADGPQDNMTLKMSTFKWVHVLLLQLNSGISLPSPDLCNGAVCKFTYSLPVR